MPYLEITNFKFGLDERRSELTSQIGSLDTLNNAHVNEGGECEKRRAFLPMSVAPVIPNGRTLGFEADNTGLILFGSAASTSSAITTSEVATAVAVDLNINQAGYLATVAANVITIVHSSGANIALNNLGHTVAGGISFGTNNTPSVTITFTGAWADGDLVQVHATVNAVVTNFSFFIQSFPTASTTGPLDGGGTYPGIRYQRLVHPYVTYGNTATITRIAESCTYAGLAFCIALYSDGSTILFYDGTAVVDSYAGLITTGITAVPGNYINLSAATLSMVPLQATGYTTVAGIAGAFKVVATTGTFVATITTSSTNGTLTVDNPNPSSNHIFQFGGTWVAGDTFTVSLLNNGITQQFGFGTITGLGFTNCFTFKNKVYLILNTSTYFSAVGSATFFNGPDGAGNGFINLLQSSGTVDQLMTGVSYQGRLAFFFRYHIQIWSIFDDDTQNSLVQTLNHIGLISARAVQAIGDLDILFLSDSGVRSLRVRDSSLNAYTVDLGSPINATIRALLVGRTFFPATFTAAAPVMGHEPAENRVWLCLPDANNVVNMFVLSYFPQSKISAWATYDFTWNFYSTTQTAMTVEKWITYKGMIIGRGQEKSTGAFVDAIILYDPTTIGRTVYAAGFDNCTATVATPWMSGKTAGTNKIGRSLDGVSAGKWALSASMDPKGGTMDQTSNIGSTTTPDATQDSTVDYWSFPIQASGTHFRLLATCSAAIQAVLSSFIFHFKEGNEKP